MASLGTVTAKVAVKPTVGIGPTTVAGSAITLAAYAVAIVAFIHGARDEQTISALAIGTLSLLTTLGGRYAQAVAAVLTLKRAPMPTAPQPFVSTGQPSGNTVSALTWTEPHPGMAVTNPVTTPTTKPAPFTPDGDPVDDDTTPDDLAGLPAESFIADPDDTAGASDHPEDA